MHPALHLPDAKIIISCWDVLPIIDPPKPPEVIEGEI